MSAMQSEILDRIKNRALGNSKRGLKEVACDLLNNQGGDIKTIAAGTFLCTSTLKRVLDCEDKYTPQSQTLERIFRYCGLEISFMSVDIKPRFLNKPKE